MIAVAIGFGLIDGCPLPTPGHVPAWELGIVEPIRRVRDVVETPVAWMRDVFYVSQQWSVYQAPIDAQTTREQLQEILRQYPPAVGEVLRRDTSLLNRPDYIAPYPQLVAFMQQHPEITRNPAFFFGGYDYYEPR